MVIEQIMKGIKYDFSGGMILVKDDMEIVDLQEMKLIGFEIVDSLNNVIKTQSVGKLREELAARRREIHNRTKEGIFLVQIYTEEEWGPDIPYQHVVGVQVDSFGHTPNDMIEHTIPAGRYIKLIHQGPESQIGDSYDRLMNWIEQGNHRVNCGYDFEYWEDIQTLEHPDSQIPIYKPLIEEV